MKRIFFIALAGCLSFLSVAQSEQQSFKSYETFIVQVKKFIDTCKPQSVWEGKYNVYYAKLYPDTDRNAYCVCITYINNWWAYDMVNPKFAFTIDSEIIILNLDKIPQQDWLNKINYSVVDSAFKQKIMNKLPQRTVVINGYEPGLIFCYKNDSVKKLYYENAEGMPADFQFLQLPPGGTIRKIK